MVKYNTSIIELAEDQYDRYRRVVLDRDGKIFEELMKDGVILFHQLAMKLSKLIEKQSDFDEILSLLKECTSAYYHMGDMDCRETIDI